MMGASYNIIIMLSISYNFFIIELNNNLRDYFYMAFPDFFESHLPEFMPYVFAGYERPASLTGSRISQSANAAAFLRSAGCSLFSR